MFRTLVKSVCVLLLFLAFLASGAMAADRNATPPQLRGSGLPVPRFVTLKAAEVSLRTGPGTIYPIEWIFVRRGMPVEITAEFDTWRRIRDWEGAEGWVHQSLVSGQRAVVVTGAVRPLRRKPVADSAVLAQLEPGVIAALEECPKDSTWCRIALDEEEGWVRRQDVWGVYTAEAVE
ncbi:MAG: SH3 domain-containing protein [Pseudomonadota bacterium]|nr:SH3 domain-containing protein [Pseudomonadota bacterium]